MSVPYTKKILENFLHPKNVGEIKNADAIATEGSSICGDVVKLFIKVDPKTHKIVDIKFKSYGCAANIATASIITELAKGKTINKAKKISWEKANKELGGLPPVKVHCAVLAIDALKSAIDNYEQAHGLIREKVPTDGKIIIKRLRHIINPIFGKDVVSTKLIKEIKIKDGIISIKMNLAPDHQFYNNISDEIKERLEPLWDVKKVDIVGDLDSLTSQKS